MEMRRRTACKNNHQAPQYHTVSVGSGIPKSFFARRTTSGHENGFVWGTLENAWHQVALRTKFNKLFRTSAAINKFTVDAFHNTKQAFGSRKSSRRYRTWNKRTQTIDTSNTKIARISLWRRLKLRGKEERNFGYAERESDFQNMRQRHRNAFGGTWIRH